MTKKLRSFIQEHFPHEFRVQTELISRRRDVSLNEKKDLIINALKDFKIGNVVSLGSGTNRYAFKLDGFVVKVATDQEGKLDNLNEFKLTRLLPMDIITRSYEVSSNGNLLIAEYAAVFVSYTDFYAKREIVEEKLERLNRMGYLVGDVGITDKNFTNWGLRVGNNDPVILDYAYTYDVNSEQLICQKCNAGVLLVPTSDYSKLKCPACKQLTLFQDLRRRIGTQEHIKRIGDLSEIGYVMSEAVEEKTLDVERSFYLKRKRSSNVETPIIEEKVSEESEPFVVPNKEEMNMSWTDKIANDPNSQTPFRIATPGRRIVANPVTVAATPESPIKYRGPQIIVSPPAAEMPPVNTTLQDVSGSSVHFEDDDPVDETEEDTTEEVEPPKEEEESEEKSKDESKDESLDGILDVTVSTRNGYTVTVVGISGLKFPIYGPILKVAERQKVLDKPVDFSFFRHFRPTNYFVTDTPNVFEGVGDCDKSIIFVKLGERKNGTLFGVYGIGDMCRLSDDGTEINFNAENREKFTKALSYAINQLFSESGALTISRYEPNRDIPDTALTPIYFINELCESNGIELNTPSDPEDEDLSAMGEDALAGLFEKTENMANRDDPDHSDYEGASQEFDEHDLDYNESGEEGVVSVEEPIIPTRSNFFANPAGSDVIAPIRRRN